MAASSQRDRKVRIRSQEQHLPCPDSHGAAQASQCNHSRIGHIRLIESLDSAHPASGLALRTLGMAFWIAAVTACGWRRPVIESCAGFSRSDTEPIEDVSCAREPRKLVRERIIADLRTCLLGMDIRNIPYSVREKSPRLRRSTAR